MDAAQYTPTRRVRLKISISSVSAIQNAPPLPSVVMARISGVRRPQRRLF